jgi:hypothetical protein
VTVGHVPTERTVRGGRPTGGGGRSRGTRNRGGNGGGQLYEEADAYRADGSGLRPEDEVEVDPNRIDAAGIAEDLYCEFFYWLFRAC